jgi:chromosome segregation ATPase
MHSMDYFFRLRRSQEDDTSDHELLRKRAEESLNLLWAEGARVGGCTYSGSESKEQELEAALTLGTRRSKNFPSRLKARAEALEAQLSRDALEAQAKISNLEATIVTNNATIQSLQKELSSAKIQAEIESRASEIRISHSLEEALIQRSKAEDLKTRLHRAKEQLRKYKEKARSFYKQLTFASWARDSGFHVGYMEGIESLRSWVQKPGNFPKVDAGIC